MKTTPELELAVFNYKNGDDKAFIDVYELSKKYIQVCIRNVVIREYAVDDVILDMMQETYLEVSKSINQLTDNKDFLSWASTIANRKCFAYIKKNRKTILLDDEDTTFDTLADSDDIIPESIIQDKEKQRLLKSIIDNSLSDIQKLCVVGYYYNEQKQEEIASELGLPLNTVKTNLSRAKAKIKEGVLTLEKNKGTKLYSVAPFMLFLFSQEVQTCTVPDSVSTIILNGVSETLSLAAGAAGTSGATGTVGATVATETIGAAGTTGIMTTTSITKGVGLVSKIACLSVKAKIILATVALIAMSGGAVTLATILKEPAIKTESTEAPFVQTEITLSEEKTKQVNPADLLAQIYKLNSSYSSYDVYTVTDDYDGNGTSDYFFIFTKKGTPKAATNPSTAVKYYSADIWFGGSQGVERIVEWKDIVADSFCTLNLGPYKYFRYDTSFPNQTFTKLLDVANNKCVESLSAVENASFNNSTDFSYASSEYDLNCIKATKLYTGHTRKPYYFYVDSTGFHEYLATVISEAEFKKYAGSDKILEEIKQKYGDNKSVLSFEFLKRSNGRLHINIMNETAYDITYHYMTYAVNANNSLEFKFNGEGYYLLEINGKSK